MAFHGKVAVVTGSASGMGRISALRLARAGAQVAILDRNREALEKVANEAQQLHPYVCDIRDPKAIGKTMAKVVEDLGPVERLTHAAGILPTELLAKMPAEEILRIMEVNYHGTVHMVKSVLDDMLERRRGDIIMFGSIAGHVLTPHMGAYSASKAAVNIFGEQLIRETKGSGVRILLVKPPAVDTPLIDQAVQSSDPVLLRTGRDQGRYASPDFIVDAIEAGIERGAFILKPGFEAKWLDWARRLAPGMLWAMIESMAKKAEQEDYMKQQLANRQGGGQGGRRQDPDRDDGDAQDDNGGGKAG